MNGHAEAQELHGIIGGVLEMARGIGQYDTIAAYEVELERALELAAIQASDTDPDNRPRPTPAAQVHPSLWPELLGTLYGAIVAEGQITVEEWNAAMTAHGADKPRSGTARRVRDSPQA